MVALVSGVAAGTAVSVPIFVATARQTEQLADRQERVEQERAERQEVLENVRFVRDRVADPGGLKPFAGLDLRGASLAGLPMGCTTVRPAGADEERRCVDLSGANLTRANLTHANLSGANLTDANLTDADLFAADLTLANLTNANLTDADLFAANLTGANLTLANLTDANLTDANLTDAHLTGVCYDDLTTWPAEFEPPAARAVSCP